MIEVYTGPEWLMQYYQGYTSDSGRSMVVIGRDSLNRPYIGKTIATDPVWNLSVQVTNPYTQEARPLLSWLELITIPDPMNYETSED